ncbi:hypothetical protein PMIT1320_00075 [Prochlorococcus marinus str. MIT 1320]|nr:hypothetical protein PMIT1320_00075 [Prochlorococcus marinus str. MIT 1320]
MVIGGGSVGQEIEGSMALLVKMQAPYLTSNEALSRFKT